jgi:hypothetical protein
LSINEINNIIRTAEKKNKIDIRVKFSEILKKILLKLVDDHSGPFLLVLKKIKNIFEEIFVPMKIGLVTLHKILKKNK